MFIGAPDPFGPVDLVPDPPTGFTAYERANLSGATDTFSVTQAEFQGVRFGFARAFDLAYGEGSGRFDRAICVFGVPTVLADIFPRAGEDYSDIAFLGFATRVDSTTGEILQRFDLSSSILSFSADVDDQDVVTISVSPRGREILADGSLSATVFEFEDLVTQSSKIRFGPDGATGFDDPNAEAAQFEGELTAPGAMTSFSLMSGWFFGPQAEEAGFTFFVEYVDDQSGGDDRLILNGLGLAKQ
ncbi:hypothetical protein N9D37_01695 [Erythrobacter sp.]|nr:hypothetical protein [Erythrobacter sp.]